MASFSRIRSAPLVGPHPFTAQLVAALRDLGGLDRLSAGRLGELRSAADMYGGDLGGLRAELAAAWECARPPCDAELVDLDWDSGLIDWLDVEDLAELVGDPDGPWDPAERDAYWHRIEMARVELEALAAGVAEVEAAQIPWEVR